uniref:Secreted protein n=1 Tax=Glossina pallidipes TaxID=7398 RepID=A0A1A9ZCV8_GLOPL
MQGKGHNVMNLLLLLSSLLSCFKAGRDLIVVISGHMLLTSAVACKCKYLAFLCCRRQQNKVNAEQSYWKVIGHAIHDFEAMQLLIHQQASKAAPRRKTYKQDSNNFYNEYLATKQILILVGKRRCKHFADENIMQQRVHAFCILTGTNGSEQINELKSSKFENIN